MRGLTQIRGEANVFPTVEALRQLAADVRTILGPDVEISYAADWSEYFGYHPQDGSGDVWFHLDALWADPNIDFIGIDNYMPLSDWRDGEGHLDTGVTDTIYDLDYLSLNIEGGEGFDWYYHSPEAHAAQIRTPIEDTAYGEDWVFRYKDMRSWWSKHHFNRIGGIKDQTPTDWLPGSKPIVFTELGCPAIDKGSNQPNTFYDPKSSESAVPNYSNGMRDELIQKQFLRAQLAYWQGARNPVHPDTEIQMLDMSRAHIWAWDARPYPVYPNNSDLWSDADNYRYGHWLNGRTGIQTLADVVTEICAESGVTDINVENLYGIVRGYADDGAGTARAALQPLALVHGFDAVERNGVLTFQNRDALVDGVVEAGECVAIDDAGEITFQRGSEAETISRVNVTFVEAGGDYAIKSQEAIYPDEGNQNVAQSEISMTLTSGEAMLLADRWLAEARVARDQAAFSLPPSKMHMGAGDVIQLGEGDIYRIDSVEQGEFQRLESVRIDANLYQPKEYSDVLPTTLSSGGFAPLLAQFMDIPAINESLPPHAPYIAVGARSWPGAVAVYGASQDADYQLNRIVNLPSVIGVTETILSAGAAGLWDSGAGLRVRLQQGALSSASTDAVLNGANLAAIGDGSPGGWELFQFTSADLVDERTYVLSGRLRGQFGSEIPAEWPVGSRFILLSDQVQLDHALDLRDIPRHFRIGPAAQPLDGPGYQHQVHAFKGIGLRPYAPVHLRGEKTNGDWHFNWIRQTRENGDSWSGVEVPLGEETESYQVQVLLNGSVVRETYSSLPAWTYSQAEQTLDGVTGAFVLSVAQLSNVFGPGRFARISISA